MKKYLNDREVEVTEVSAYHSDVVDCFIESAYFVDNGEPLTDDELYQIAEDYPEYIYDQWFENKISAVDFID
jgi:hypothetical protein